MTSPVVTMPPPPFGAWGRGESRNRLEAIAWAKRALHVPEFDNAAAEAALLSLCATGWLRFFNGSGEALGGSYTRVEQDPTPRTNERPVQRTKMWLPPRTTFTTVVGADGQEVRMPTGSVPEQWVYQDTGEPAPPPVDAFHF